MSELVKKQLYSVSMTKDTKQKLNQIAKQLVLPQGDALALILKEYLSFQNRLEKAYDNTDLLKVMISQQNILIKTLQEQNALLLQQQH